MGSGYKASTGPAAGLDPRREADSTVSADFLQAKPSFLFALDTFKPESKFPD
jgi:hypothetical protein